MAGSRGSVKDLGRAGIVSGTTNCKDSRTPHNCCSSSAATTALLSPLFATQSLSEPFHPFPYEYYLAFLRSLVFVCPLLFAYRVAKDPRNPGG